MSSFKLSCVALFQSKLYFLLTVIYKFSKAKDLLTVTYFQGFQGVFKCKPYHFNNLVDNSCFSAVTFLAAVLSQMKDPRFQNPKFPKSWTSTMWNRREEGGKLHIVAINVLELWSFPSPTNNIPSMWLRDRAGTERGHSESRGTTRPTQWHWRTSGVESWVKHALPIYECVYT